MTEWIKYPENKPPHFTEALVVNEKGWMHGKTKAYYHAEQGCWIAILPHMSETLTLEISHYLPIPELPRK